MQKKKEKKEGVLHTLFVYCTVVAQCVFRERNNVHTGQYIQADKSQPQQEREMNVYDIVVDGHEVNPFVCTWSQFGCWHVAGAAAPQRVAAIFYTLF